MRNLSAKQGMATFLGVCLVIFFPYAVNANTGSAITGDGGGGNLDSSTFGDFFAVPKISARGWKCLNRPICPDCDLRLQTLAKMLSTNLSGTLIQKVIQGSAPRFSCDSELATRAIAFQDLALLKSPVSPSGQTLQMNSSGSGAALLEGVQPASLGGQFPINTSVIVAQAVAPDPVPPPPRKGNEPFPAANVSPSANQLNEELQKSLNFQSDPIDPAKSQSIKSESLQTLVTTLQGLVWEESLADTTQQINVDVEQLAAAIQAYNDLLRLMSVEELNAWRSDRNGQDITTVLKQLREGVTVQQ
jgi:hypothetical protein